MTKDERDVLKVAVSNRRRELVGDSAEADRRAAATAARRARRLLENKEERNRKDREYRLRRKAARAAAQ